MILQLENISIGYNKKALLSSINASLKLGDVCAVVGKNGSGKTTLLTSILQLLPILEGKIVWNGKSIKQYTPQELSKQMAVVLSSSEITIPISTKEFIKHGRYPYKQLSLRNTTSDEELLLETAEYLEITNLLPLKVNELSDGNFQKVCIARAIIQDTPIIILDEPLSHLDTSNQFMILDILQRLAQEKQKLIIYTTHDWNYSLRIANQLWFIKENKFYSGFTEDVALQHNLIEHLGNNNYDFDYCLHQFQPKKRKNMFKINVKQHSSEAKKLYWLYQSLSKHNIEITTETENTIIVLPQGYKIQINNTTFECETIFELIHYLNL